MRTFLRFLIAFILVAAAAAFATTYLGIQFGRDDFWQNHGIFFLIFITIFPRLTLLLSSVASGGILWWLSWLFVPRILVAVLATLAYWNQNPVLVVISWLVAFGGESSEKYVAVKRRRANWQFGTFPGMSPRGPETHKGFEDAKWVDSDSEPTDPHQKFRS